MVQERKERLSRSASQQPYVKPASSPSFQSAHRPQVKAPSPQPSRPYQKASVASTPNVPQRLYLKSSSRQELPKASLFQKARIVGQVSRQAYQESKKIKQDSLASFQRFTKVRPGKAVKQAKREYKQVSKTYKEAKRQYKRSQRKPSDRSLTISKTRLSYLKSEHGQAIRVRSINYGRKASPFQRISKEDLRTLKAKKKEAKQVRNLAYQRNGGTFKRKVARKAYQSNRRLAESTVSDHETLGDIAEARQKIRRTKANYHQAKRMARYGGKLGAKATKHGYGLSNRAYNFIRGRGFTRTAVGNRWEVKLAKKMRRFKNRLLRSKAGKAAKGIGKVTKLVTKPFRSILSNPLSIKSYILLFMMLMVMSLFMSSSSTMSQSEENLNKTWKHLSKLDREFSTEKVDYWTTIDDIIYYMNYRYEDFALSDKVDPEPKQFKDVTYDLFLGEIWKGLNDDVDHLKTMEDLYAKKDSPVPDLILTEDELEEYKELLELGEETGRYLPYQELASPFSAEEEEPAQPLVIGKRFGYISPSEMYDGTVLQVDNGHDLYAVMAGEIKVYGNKVIITSDDAEFTYSAVGSIRVKTGDMVTKGDLIGKVNSSDGQEIFYKKLSDGLIDTWEYVNPGFYFEKVTYTQSTSVIQDIDFSNDITGRILQAYELIKKHFPKATMNGVAAMLGNFWTESSITAKRAEGDFLPPPVGASDNSWDDPAWLSLGGPAIYNGGYGNILHRGLGLGQWTDTSDGAVRHTMLLNYAKEKGKKWYDLDLQIDFIFNGDSPYYRQTARDILSSNESVDILTERFLARWEGVPGNKLAQRQNNAKQVLEILKNPSPSAGGYGHPFKVPYVVLQPYGYTAWSTGAGAYLYTASGGKHTGVDIQAYGYERQDIPIYSMTNGKVIYNGWSDLGGHAIVIETDFGGFLYYGHNKYASPLSVGSKVTKGQQIAILGSSGMTNVYHIHLEYTTSPHFGTGVYDKDPSFLFQKTGTLKQGQVIKP